MNRFLRPALVAAALVLIGVVSAPLAHAQQQPPTMTVDPTTLTFGTTFTVSLPLRPRSRPRDGLAKRGCRW